MNILIAEDNLLTAKLLTNKLKAQDDISSVTHASNGFEAISYINNYNIDLMLLDISMPKMDGMQTLYNLSKINSDVKVIMLSIHDEGWIIKKSIAIGAKGYVTKKSTVDELMAGIHAVMRNDIYLCSIARDSVENDKETAE